MGLKDVVYRLNFDLGDEVFYIKWNSQDKLWEVAEGTVGEIRALVDRNKEPSVSVAIEDTFQVRQARDIFLTKEEAMVHWENHCNPEPSFEENST